MGFVIFAVLMTAIAVLHGGDSADPTEGSGVPFGLTSGLAARGIDVRRVDVALPRPFDRRLRRMRWTHAEYARLKSQLARRRLAAAGMVDGIRLIGLSFSVTTTVPTATYDDMTVPQHEQYGAGAFLRYPRHVRKAWHARQRANYMNATVCTVMSKWAGESIVIDFGCPV